MKYPNPLHVCDFYKTGHIKFYDKGTELVYSNFTPRSTKYLPKVQGTDDKLVVYGIQHTMSYINDCWNHGFFSQPKEKVLKAYQHRMDTSLGAGAVSIEHISKLHDLGYLPISIRALPEGSVINEKIPAFTIKNTHPEMAWLTNYLEDFISLLSWRAMTAATIVRKYKLIALKYAELTGVDKGLVDWLLHDFSLRGCSGIQDAQLIGSAFLLFQKGTDNVMAIDFLEDYYHADSSTEVIGGSIPANEHSCVCVGGKENEFDNYKRWITEVFPNGFVSLVSDTWSLWNVLTNYLPRLKTEIMARDGKVVIRPDSSPKTPLEIICGDPEALDGSPESKGVVQILWETFGGTVNDKGFKVLDSHIGCIYGEAIQPALADKIYKTLMDKGFAISNVVFGLGSMGFVLTTRDTTGSAMKATYAVVNGVGRDLFKDPVTDSGTKKSAKGLLRVDLVDGEYILKDQCTAEEENGGELKEIYRNGQFLIRTSLSEIRARVAKSL